MIGVVLMDNVTCGVEDADGSEYDHSNREPSSEVDVDSRYELKNNKAHDDEGADFKEASEE